MLLNEDAFNATKNVSYQYGQYFRAFADELGRNKAMKLSVDANKR